MNKWLLIIIAVAIIYFMFRNDFRHKKIDLKKKKESVTPTGELSKDPTCGTYVNINDSISVKNGSNVYHFCSYECRDKFLDSLEHKNQETPKLGGDNE